MPRQGGSGGVGRHHHQNTYAFRHNKYSKLTAKIQQLQESHLCTKCTAIIEWRKQYRKYKPLSDATKCCYCKQRTVTHAYHNACDKCSDAKHVCAKCLQSFNVVTEQETNKDAVTVEQLQNAIDSSIIAQRYKQRLKRLYNDNKLTAEEIIEKIKLLEQQQINRDTGVNTTQDSESSDFTDDDSNSDAEHTNDVTDTATQQLQQLDVNELKQQSDTNSSDTEG